MSSRSSYLKSPATASTRTAAVPTSQALRRADELANTFKMLANSNRLKILVFLAKGERAVGDIESALNIHQPTLSQQLGELRDAGLIKGRKVAKSVIYALTERLGQRAIDTIYLANGHAPSAPPVPLHHPSNQAAVFAAVLSTRGSHVSGWQPAFKSLLQD